MEDQDYRDDEMLDAKKKASSKPISARDLLDRMYSNQRTRSLAKGMPLPSYSSSEFRNRWIFDPKFLRLYAEWKSSGYSKWLVPSVDRIDNKVHYTFQYTHMMTWNENKYKQSMERRRLNTRLAQLVGGNVIALYINQMVASAKTGVSQGNISEVLHGKRMTAGGYSWKYLNDLEVS